LRPNPAKNSVNLNYPTEESEEVVIKLCNVFGQNMMETRLRERSIELDVSAYRQGIYFIHVFVNGVEKENHKLVIIK
jgi:hypothetical protein